MGFFDKIKSGLKDVANRVTGGYGELELKVENPTVQPGEEVRFQVLITAKADFSATAVLAELEAYERVNFEQEADGVKASARGSSRTLELKETLCGEFALSEGQTKELSGSFKLPADAPITYDGKHCEHEYELSVRVDVAKATDLRKSEKIEVVTRAPSEEKNGECKVDQAENQFTILLTCSDMNLVPGEDLRYSAVVAAKSQTHVKSWRVSVVGAEEYSCDRMAVSSGDGEESSSRTLDDDTVPLPHFEWDQERRALSIAGGSMDLHTLEPLAIPKSAYPTYRGPKCQNRYFLKLEVQASGCEPLTAAIPLTVYGERVGGSPEASSGVSVKFVRSS